jgi:hypothetical protein
MVSSNFEVEEDAKTLLNNSKSAGQSLTTSTAHAHAVCD